MSPWPVWFGLTLGVYVVGWFMGRARAFYDLRRALDTSGNSHIARIIFP